MTLFSQRPELLAAFRRGEKTALTTVYNEYARPLYGMISKGFTVRSGKKKPGSGEGEYRFPGYRSDPFALEDAVQETFRRAFEPEARGKEGPEKGYDGVSCYRNYLFRIACNLILDRHRQRVRRDDEAVDDFECSYVEANSEPEQAEKQIFDKEIAEQCEAFLASLNAQERALFEARFHKGLSIEKTALTLEIKEHKVKSGEKQLKKRFFRMMKDCGYFQGYRMDKIGIAKITSMLLLYAALRGR